MIIPEAGIFHKLPIRLEHPLLFFQSRVTSTRERYSEDKRSGIGDFFWIEYIFGIENYSYAFFSSESKIPSVKHRRFYEGFFALVIYCRS